jgi:cytochrome c oxidase subunit II
MHLPLDAWRAKQKPEKGEDPALIAKGRELFRRRPVQLPHDPRRRRHRGGGPGADPRGRPLDDRRRPPREQPRRARRWIHAPNEVKPGNKMWVNGYLANHIKLTPDDEDALVVQAYLESLK